MKTAWLNLFFRGLTLGSKFILAIFIARYLTLEELGIYGILNISVTLSVYLIGLDFYTYSVRNLLDSPIEKRGSMLRDQLVFYLLTYMLFLPLLYLLFAFRIIDTEYLLLFYGILILEHLSQESYRLFITFSKPIIANVILFIRSGIWIYFIVGAWIFEMKELQNIESVIIFWFTGTGFSVILAVILFSQFKLNVFSKTPINWRYINQGFIISLPFFAGTIAYKIVEFSDRYLIDAWHGKEMVGIYTFYAGIGNLVEVVVQTTVIMIFSPKLIETYNRNKVMFNDVFNNFRKQVLLASFGILIVASFGIYPVILFLKKPEFFENISIFFWLATSKVLFNFSMIYHYQLYVRKADKMIMWATFIGAGCNILLNFLLIPSCGIQGAAVATFLSFGAIYLAKFYFYKQIKVAQL